MPSAKTRAIRTVACFEAFKGALVLLAATGLLSLSHRELHAFAAAFIAHLHLNPASKYPHIFLDLTAKVSDSRLLLLAAGALAYSLVRFIEAYGLFREKAWAETLAALSGAIYVPFEILELTHGGTWHGVALLAVNVLIVGIMVRALVERRARDA